MSLRRCAPLCEVPTPSLLYHRLSLYGVSNTQSSWFVVILIVVSVVVVDFVLLVIIRSPLIVIVLRGYADVLGGSFKLVTSYYIPRRERIRTPTLARARPTASSIVLRLQQQRYRTFFLFSPFLSFFSPSAFWRVPQSSRFQNSSIFQPVIFINAKYRDRGSRTRETDLKEKVEDV